MQSDAVRDWFRTKATSAIHRTVKLGAIRHFAKRPTTGDEKTVCALSADKDPDVALSNGMHHISQNVPANTAKDMAEYIVQVLDRKIPLSQEDYYLFDNTKGMRIVKGAPGSYDPSEDENDE